MSKNSKQLLIILGFIFVLRIPALYQPVLDMDESVFSEFANIVLEGGIPYIDAVDNKPPLTYYFFALVYTLFGKNNLIAVHIITTLIVMATAFFIYVTCREFLNEKTGIISALVFAVLSHIYEPKYISTNGETLINLPVIISGFLYIKYSGLKKRNIYMLILSGLLLGTGIMINYKAGILAIVFILFSLIIRVFLSNENPKPGIFLREFYNLSLAGSGTLIVIASILLYFYSIGNLKEFLYWGFSYNFKYIETGSAVSPIFKTITRASYFLLCSLPIWILSIIYFGKRIKGILKEPPLYLFTLLWLIFSFYAVIQGGRTYGHYFIQLIVPLSLLAGIAYNEIINNNKRKGLFWGYLFFISLLFLISRIDIEATYKLINYPNRKADINYKLLGEYINKDSSPEDKIYAWGWAASIYYYSDRRCGARFLISDYISGRIFGTPNDSRLIRSDPREEEWHDFISDLEKNQPIFFIDTSPANHYGYSRFPLNQYPELYSIISNNYSKIGSINKTDIYKINQ